MAKKKEEVKQDVKLTEKEKKQIKENIIEDIKDDLTVEITEEIVEEVNKSFDKDYKEDLKIKISDEIAAQIKEEIRREEKKVSRQKSFRILRLNLYIILLLAGICFLVYKIYKNDHMEILGLEKLGHGSIEVVTKPVNPGEETPITESDLLGKYGDLMDKIKLTSNEYLLGNLKISELPMASRISLAYNTLESSDIDIEGTIYTLDGKKISNAYKNLYNLDDYEPTAFETNGINYKYSTKTDSYIAITDKEPTKEDILLEISEITEDDSYIYISNLVAIHQGEYIYNKDNLKSSVAKYKDKMELSTYKNKLTKSTFVFTKGEIKGLYAIN